MPNRKHFQPVRAALAALLLAGALAALAVTPALAARGHIFGKTFGGPGSGPGQFDKPAGAAVNEATGDVYVVDEGNNRVERFTAAGGFLGQFDGSGSFEVEGEEETGGKPATGKFDKPRTVAVDNSCVHLKHGEACKDPSAGDVYVADGFSHKVLVKFTAAGEYLGTLEPAGANTLAGVAVDAHGDVWVGENRLAASLPGFERFGDGEPNEHREFVQAGHTGWPLRHGLAVDSEGNLYAGTAFESPFEQVVAEYGTEEEVDNGQRQRVLLSEAVLRETTSGVASELPSDDVYLNNLASVARLDSAGNLVERFGEAHLPSVSEVETYEPFGRGDYDSGVAVDAASEEGQVYVPDAVANDVVVFPLEPPGPPTVEGVSVSDVTASSATFQAEVNPRGALTEYHVEYGECPSVISCVGAPFERVVPEPDATVGAPFEFETQQVSIHPQELVPGTTYHFRVVAHNEKSQAGTVVRSEEKSFTTQPVEPFVLPDGRAWELVSPPQKHGALIKSIGAEYVIQAAANGGAITFGTASPTESEPRGFSNGVQVFASRTTAGWSSQDIALPHERATGFSLHGGEYRLFSQNLSLGVVQPFGAFEPAVSPKASEQTPYVHSDFSGGSSEEQCAAGCYRPLATAGNVWEGVRFGEEGQCPPRNFCGPLVVGASPDAQHVVMRSNVGLTSIPGDEGGLYESGGGALSLVSVRPDGKPAPPASVPTLVSEEGATRNAVSGDGSRVVWSENSGEHHLYLRDIPGEETVELDRGLTGTPEFQTASSDLSRVFFTEAGELYMYEVEKGEAVRLTTTVEAGAHTEVRGLIAGASEDGSYVYFVANGKLTEGGAPVKGNCELGAPSATQCNLYELHETGGVWESPQVVAVLSGEDAPDFASRLDEMTARVSPDGRWLAFMSDRSLTGYDNRDAESGRPDEEVYLYDAATGRVSCASCNPTGARPVGVEYAKIDDQLAGGDRVWNDGTWIAANVPGWTKHDQRTAFYQSRYLSDSGRLFFNSSDVLSPQDTNGTEDVYEFEPPGIGGCTTASLSYSARSGGCVDLISSGTSGKESAFLDASETGDDVFFLTSAQLVRQDFDTAVDVYDAHVCSAASPCVPEAAATPPPCATEASCKAPPTPQPEIFGPPASATFSGLGNILPMPPAAVVKKVAKKTVKCKHGLVKSKKGKCVRKAKPKKRGKK